MIEFKNAKINSELGGKVQVHGLRIPEGHSVGIIGKVSSGKSSVLYSMLGFGEITQGSLTCDGQCVFKNKVYARSQMTIVPRNDGLMANS